MFCGNDITCGCEKSTKNTNYAASAGCADDNAAVAAMPQEWIPKRGGSTLANYLKDREQNHEDTIRDLHKQATKLNEVIDDKVRAISEELLANIRVNERNIDCVLSESSSSQETLSPEQRNEALKRIKSYYNIRVENISNFIDEANALERDRADGLKNILRDQFQKLVNVGFHPPKTLLIEIDDMIYEINQQFLSNCRAYLDLKAQLLMQADESLIRAKSFLNQLCLGISFSQRRRSAFILNEIKSSRRVNSASSERIHDYRVESVSKIVLTKEELDVCITKVVSKYRAAVLKVVKGFYSKLCDLHCRIGCFEFMGKDYSLNEITDLEEMTDQTMRLISESVDTKLCITSSEFLDIQKSLYSLGECLMDTYTVLHEAGHLWDAHMIRTAYAQKLTIAAVEDLSTNNDTVELANEMTFNIALEQLRCMADSDKLKQHFNYSLDLLERTAEMYQQHHQAEVDRLEQFMTFPIIKANILMSEFHCFLDKYRRPSVFVMNGAGSNQSISSANRESIAATITSPLPRAIFQTRLNEIALRNWRNGFLEIFENNISIVPEELLRQARNWVNEKLVALNFRHSMKMVSHSIRFDRLVAARDARLAELRHHETRLESHLQAINDMIDRLPIETSECLSADSSEVYPFYDWIDRIQTDMDNLLAQDPLDPETKRLKMTSYAMRLPKFRKSFEDSLDLAMDSCKWRMESRVQEARVSNVRFLSQLKLFSQGGRYAAQEAIRASVSLVRVADALEACVSRTLDTLNHRRLQLLAAADQRLAPILKIVDETAKINKGGADKRKPPPKKK